MNAKTLGAGLLALVLGLTVVPANAAFYDPGVPLQDHNTFNATGAWRSWRVTVPADGHIEVEGDGNAAADASTASVGVWLLHSDGSLYGAGVITFLAGQTTAHVEVQGSPLIDVRQGGLGGFFGGGIGFLGLAAGEWRVVAITTSDKAIAGGEIDLFATGGSVVSAKTAGSGAFVAQDVDFHGTLVAKVDVPLGPEVRAILDAHYPVSVGGSLFALYETISYGACLTHYSGPDGGSTQPVVFVHGGPSGDYDFAIDQCFDGGAAFFKSFTFVMGADVTLA